MRGAPGMYRMLRRIIPPIATPYLRLEIEGLGHIPADGPAVLACNHLSFIDSIVLPLYVPRPVYFLGKADYWDSWRTRWFVQGTGVVPVYRDGGEKGAGSLRTGVEILRRGDLLGIYPEGTRSPDGRMFKGKTGPVRMALEAGAPIVPCAVLGSDRAMPSGKRVPRRHPVTVRYGEPLDLSHYRTDTADPGVLRTATDELMTAIMGLSGQRYVDAYASDIKSGAVGPADVLPSTVPGNRGPAAGDDDANRSFGVERDRH
ncbi:MAG: lysophospholipid acyltransferase family protein [Nitriliruptoraceae bacterium]